MYHGSRFDKYTGRGYQLLYCGHTKPRSIIYEIKRDIPRI
jgi:hypothetical protein